MKGLESKFCEEHLRELEIFSLEKSRREECLVCVTSPERINTDDGVGSNYKF